MSHLKLVSYKPEAFAGINAEEGPIFNGTDMVLIFPDDKRITEFSADQGAGKTSNLECLRMLLGGEEAPNALNETANQVKADITFVDERDGATYNAKRTKSSFSIQKNHNGEKSTINSPKQWLRNMIGNIGLNPMDLRAMKGKEQIEWLRKICPFTEEQQKLEKDILQKHTTAYNERTEVNRDVANLKKEIVDSGYFLFDDDNMVFHSTELMIEHSKKVAGKTFNDEEVAAAFNAAEANHRKYEAGKQKVESQRLVSDTLQKEIEELQKKLDDKKKALAEVETTIENGEKWIKENVSFETEYETAKKNMQEAGALQIIQRNVNDITKKHDLFETKQQEQINLNAKLDELIVLHKQLIAASTPEIEGLEVLVGGLDTKPEGLYYKGMPIANSCESEVWEFFFQIKNMRIVLIENISSLGSGAIERINQFVAGGGRVFCTKMERGREFLKVSFYDKLS